MELLFLRRIYVELTIKFLQLIEKNKRGYVIQAAKLIAMDDK